MDIWRRLSVAVLAGSCVPCAPAGEDERPVTDRRARRHVKDAQGGVLPGAVVRVTSPALMSGEERTTSNDKGQWRFPVLPPGRYVLTVELAPKFAPYHRERPQHRRGRDARTAGRPAAGRRRRIGHRGGERGHQLRGAADSRPDLDPTTSGRPDAAVQHVRPDQQRAGRVADVAGERHRQHRVGVRIGRQRERVSHRRHQLHVSLSGRVARRADRGRHPGAPRAVDGRIGRVRQHPGRRVQRRHEAGRRSLAAETSYYAPAVRPDRAAGRAPGHERAPSRRAATSASDIATSRASLGGPVKRDRLWFFGAYQYLRDYDSQPGADPAFPRKYEQNKVFGKLKWRLTPSLQMMQSFHQEIWVNPTPPTLATPFVTTQRVHASVPNMTFAQSHARAVGPHRLGGARRPVPPATRTPIPAQATGRRRSTAIRSPGISSGNAPQIGGADARPRDREGRPSPLSAWLARRRPSLQGRHADRARRASPAPDLSRGRAVRRQQRRAVPGRLPRAVDRRRRVRHAGGVCQRLVQRQGSHHGGRRRPVRSQSRDQSGSSRRRRRRTRDRRRHARRRDALHAGTSSRRGWASPRSSIAAAARCCAPATGGSIRAC